MIAIQDFIVPKRWKGDLVIATRSAPMAAGPAWVRIAFAAIAIGFAALSIHVIMLQVLHVPYPAFRGVGAWGLLALFGHVLGLAMLYRAAQPVVAAHGIVTRIVLLTLVDVMVAGKIRGAVMEGVTTLSFAHPAIGLIFGIVESLLLAALVVLLVSIVRRVTLVLLGLIAITAAFALVASPALQAAQAPFAGLAGAEIYRQPYGLGVLSISYVTFLETVAAFVAIVWIVAPRRSPRPAVNAVQSALILLLLRGTLVMQLVFPLFMAGGYAAAALSTSQFFLQDLALALGIWWLWHRSGDRVARDHGVRDQVRGLAG